MDHTLPTLRRLAERPEASLFGAVLVILAALYGFLKLGHELAEGSLGDIDQWLLTLAREHVVRSPSSAVAHIALNVTALGSYPVVVLLLLLVTGYLLLRRAPWRALYVVSVTTGGALLSSELKQTFVRARPTEVWPLAHAEGWSFPSGHALSATVVYLTLGILLASSVKPRRMKLYLLAVALLLPGLVGISRVLLGVHYPSDVLAGWMAGLAWAMSCWLVFELLSRRSGHPALLHRPPRV